MIAEVQKHLSETVADQVLSVHGNVKFSAVDDSTLFHIYTETKVRWLVTRGVRILSVQQPDIRCRIWGPVRN